MSFLLWLKPAFGRGRESAKQQGHPEPVVRLAAGAGPHLLVEDKVAVGQESRDGGHWAGGH